MKKFFRPVYFPIYHNCQLSVKGGGSKKIFSFHPPFFLLFGSFIRLTAKILPYRKRLFFNIFLADFVAFWYRSCPTNTVQHPLNQHVTNADRLLIVHVSLHNMPAFKAGGVPGTYPNEVRKTKKSNSYGVKELLCGG